MDTTLNYLDCEQCLTRWASDDDIPLVLEHMAATGHDVVMVAEVRRPIDRALQTVARNVFGSIPDECAGGGA